MHLIDVFKVDFKMYALKKGIYKTPFILFIP